MKKITDYKPLPKNPNKGTQKGMGVLDESVRQLGAGRSLLVDKNGVIIAGNHAQEAFINAGIENVIEVETTGNQVVVVKRTDMEADSIEGKKMAILDNRSSELGLAWDEVVLEETMQQVIEEERQLGVALDQLADELDIEIGEEKIDDEYTRNIEAPIYIPKGEKPTIKELFDDSKTKKLIEEIRSSNLPEDEKEFLIIAARRHTRINFKLVAEYYSQSEKEMQRQMENSALVIIDFDKAIELGYVKLSQQVAEQYKQDYD